MNTFYKNWYPRDDQRRHQFLEQLERFPALLSRVDGPGWSNVGLCAKGMNQNDSCVQHDFYVFPNIFKLIETYSTWSKLFQMINASNMDGLIDKMASFVTLLPVLTDTQVPASGNIIVRLFWSRVMFCRHVMLCSCASIGKKHTSAIMGPYNFWMPIHKPSYGQIIETLEKSMAFPLGTIRYGSASRSSGSEQ